MIKIKDRRLNIVGIGVAILILTFGVLYLFREEINRYLPMGKPQDQTSDSVEQNKPRELGDFPIYPSAVFSRPFPRADNCAPKSIGCNDYYIFHVDDSLDNVVRWYSTKRNGWECDTKTFNSSYSDNIFYCEKGYLKYLLALHTNIDKSIKLSVAIPVTN